MKSTNPLLWIIFIIRFLINKWVIGILLKIPIMTTWHVFLKAP